jgi:hypothetical protein
VILQAAFLAFTLPVVVMCRKLSQTASAVFPEGLIGQSFYDWFGWLEGIFPPCSPAVEPVSTGLSATG